MKPAESCAICKAMQIASVTAVVVFMQFVPDCLVLGLYKQINE
jgi:hypothetical protein